MNMDGKTQAGRVRIHEGQGIEQWGADVADASAVLLLLHGRGSYAGDMIGLGQAIAPDGRVCVLAPQAANGSWYPMRFMAPLAGNEPPLSSALNVVGMLLQDLAGQGMPAQRVVLGGFSQGACLALEYAARNPARYGGVFGLSGALVGPPGQARTLVPGAMQDIPVFLGCGDLDTHIPLESVRESGDVFRRLGAAVTERVYPGLPHPVNQDEVDFVRSLLEAASGNPR